MQFHFFVFRGTILEKMSSWKVKFEKAYDKLAAVISELYKEHLYLMEADRLDCFSKEMYRQIAAQKATQTMVENSLLQLTRTMQAYYGKPVILLMDAFLREFLPGRICGGIKQGAWGRAQRHHCAGLSGRPHSGI